MIRYAGSLVGFLLTTAVIGAQPPVPTPMPTTPPTQAPLQFPPTQSPTTPTPPTPEPSPADSLLANASARGTEAEATAFPTIFGDLLGGGGIAGPLPVLQTPTGQIIGPPVIVRTADGRAFRVGGPTPQQPTGLLTPVDDLIRARATEILVTTPSSTMVPPGTVVTETGLLPPPGTTFDESLAPFVARVPTFTRGSFKITENDSPRPATRAYFSYSFYDQVFKSFGGPNVPRAMLHQQLFGLEFANDSRWYSVGIRLPYNQFVAPGLVSDTSLGDLTVIGKAVFFQDEETGSLLSGGLALTLPTGTLPFPNTITGQNIRGTLIQPFLGHILARGDWFTQGFNALIVPTDSDDVTIYTNDMAFGYFAHRAPGEFFSSIIPVVETHLNVPLNHVGTQTEPVGFVPILTILGGVQTVISDRIGVGFATGAPVTGPRPFSLQATVALNAWF